MAPNLRSGTFRTISILDGSPVGVGYILPGLQFVYVDAPVTTWAVKRVGVNTYRLSVGGYPYTGVIDGKVAASIIPEQNGEWIATYREYHDAYTIEQAVDGTSTGSGWTVPYREDDERGVLEIKPIVSTKSIPPQFLPTQLFKFFEE